jgi:hypothetical protein
LKTKTKHYQIVFYGRNKKKLPIPNVLSLSGYELADATRVANEWAEALGVPVVHE